MRLNSLGARKLADANNKFSKVKVDIWQNGIYLLCHGIGQKPGQFQIGGQNACAKGQRKV